MDDNKSKRREEIFSRAVRAGKRTYFFDVKSTRAGEYYLTITESKKRFNNEQGKFYFEKHKLFLYREDFDKFKDALAETTDFIMTEQEEKPEKPEKTEKPEEAAKHTDVNFEELENTDASDTEDKDNQEGNTDDESDKFGI